jgi:hypothetical protein
MVFENRPLIRRSLFQRLFRQEPEENAIIELNNLLASRKIAAITVDDIRSIEGKYGLNLGKEFQLNLEEFYVVYLNSCIVKDFQLSESGRSDLQHLEKIFGLSNTGVSDLVRRLGLDLYKSCYNKMLRQRKFSRETALQRLVESLSLPGDIVAKLRTEGFSHFAQEYVQNIIIRNRYSPDEEAFLDGLSRQAHVSFKFPKDVALKLNRARLLWGLEHLDLVAVEVNARLQKQEHCYFQSSNVQWYEYRSVRGVREPRLLYSGDIFLTNKRVLFQGLEKNTIIKLSSITGVFDHINCLEIRKDSGRSPLITFGDMEAFGILIQRLLNGEREIINGRL